MNATTLREVTLILYGLTLLLGSTYVGSLWPLRGTPPPKPRFAKITGVLYVVALYAACLSPIFLTLTLDEAWFVGVWLITMTMLGIMNMGLAWVLRKSQPLLFWISVTATAAPIGYLLNLARSQTGNDLLYYPGLVLVVAPIFVLLSKLEQEFTK